MDVGARERQRARLTKKQKNHIRTRPYTSVHIRTHPYTSVHTHIHPLTFIHLRSICKSRSTSSYDSPSHSSVSCSFSTFHPGGADYAPLRPSSSSSTSHPGSPDYAPLSSDCQRGCGRQQLTLSMGLATDENVCIDASNCAFYMKNHGFPPLTERIADLQSASSSSLSSSSSTSRPEGLGSRSASPISSLSSDSSHSYQPPPSMSVHASTHPYTPTSINSRVLASSFSSSSSLVASSSKQVANQRKDIDDIYATNVALLESTFASSSSSDRSHIYECPTQSTSIRTLHPEHPHPSISVHIRTHPDIQVDRQIGRQSRPEPTRSHQTRQTRPVQTDQTDRQTDR
jgi:hypothetical protein